MSQLHLFGSCIIDIQFTLFC